MAKRTKGEALRALEALLERIAAEVTPLIPKAERTDERIMEDTFYRLALTFPEEFETLRKGAKAARPRDREVVSMLEEIHGELWEQPPWTGDRPIPFEGSPEPHGRPAKGSAIRTVEGLRLARERVQLKALAARFNAELLGELWHGNQTWEDESPAADADEQRARAEELMTEAFGATLDEDEDATSLRATAEDVVERLMGEVMSERYAWKNERRGRRTVRLHGPQEWAARALLALMGYPERVPWKAALSLLNVLTRGEKA